MTSRAIDPLRTHVVSGLIAKRAEIAGRIIALQAEVRELTSALEHIDATIRLFGPDIDTGAIEPKMPMAEHHAGRGGLARILFAALRHAGRALTTDELTGLVMDQRGMPDADATLRGKMTNRVRASLTHQARRGFMAREVEIGQPQRWRLAG